MLVGPIPVSAIKLLFFQFIWKQVGPRLGGVALLLRRKVRNSRKRRYYGSLHQKDHSLFTVSSQRRAKHDRVLPVPRLHTRPVHHWDWESIVVSPYNVSNRISIRSIACGLRLAIFMPSPCHLPRNLSPGTCTRRGHLSNESSDPFPLSPQSRQRSQSKNYNLFGYLKSSAKRSLIGSPLRT